MAAESEHESHDPTPQDHPNDPPSATQPPADYAAAGRLPSGEPEFTPSPPSHEARQDQPGTARRGDSPGSPSPQRSDQGRASAPHDPHDDPHDAHKHDPGKPGPKPPPKPADAQGMSSGQRLVANVLLVALGAGLMAGGFGLGRAYAPPKPPGETSNQMPADAVSKEDMKKTTDQVEKIQTNLDALSKRLDARPDYGTDVKMIRDELTQTKGMITDFPARFDSLTQKVDTISRTQTAQAGGNGDPRGDTDKRIADLSAVVDNLRSELNARPAGVAGAVSGPRDALSEGQAMEKAIGLFRAKKFNEARDAFRKLQGVLPDDARVTYYAALSNGWATGEWQGETARLVNAGMEQEKNGHPDTLQIDATFANLSKGEGKDWLDGYRQRIKTR